MKHKLIIVSVALLATACIVGETTHQIYIDSHGGVSWVVLEREVRSVSGPAERGGEEERFLCNARLGMHPVARAIALLLPESMDSRVLRAERPFEVRTEARFHSVADLAVDLLDRLGLIGTVRVWREGEMTFFEVVVEPPDSDHDLEDESILELVDDLSRYRLLMTEGTFVDAVGFEILEGGTVAVPVEPEAENWEDRTEPLLLLLSWTSE